MVAINPCLGGAEDGRDREEFLDVRHDTKAEVSGAARKDKSL